MIRKLKIKFVLLTMTSLLSLLVFIVGGMNIMNYVSVVEDADDVLSMLSYNEGRFPESGKEPGAFGAEKFEGLHRHMSPEIPYESRFFSVVLDEDGEAIHVELSQIVSVDREDAIAYAQKAVNDHSGRGFIFDLRYVCIKEGDSTRIIFLDCGRKLEAYFSFLFISLVMSVLGYLAVFVVVVIFSGKIIRPIAESYKKQKRFITDAGHEIKTPLTIINANVDVLEMEIGEDNECLTDIQTQTKRLTSLTNDLVYLSRMEEMEDGLQMIEFPVSDLISETVYSFKTPAIMQNKELEVQIQPMLTMNGNAKALEKLVSILMNNALKYSPEGSRVSVHFGISGKQLALSVENVSTYFIQKENINQTFERFYRLDASRNSETGGHGIGLSMAQAIVNAHKGEIKAWTKDGRTFGVKASFPK